MATTTRSYSFPPFYACYLLKSVQTPTSTSTYIGSTPNPPKRIRQHNGELTQGAWKTRLRRPWVMQMIVHGFPSKLAALQFEWAWQHAHISRHLRGADGKALLKRAASLNSNIRAVRLMIATHPWSTWPLYVKFFTDAAVKGWTAAEKGAIRPLPPGFMYSIELEGVDGKSGLIGSGRRGPISVDDAKFTSALLEKNTALLASGARFTCSVCQGELDNYSTDPLATALCPAPKCSAASHLLCLSRAFLTTQQPASDATSMLPRGGNCPSCRKYVLWGDVVRGTFRRAAGGAAPELDEDDDALFLPDSDDHMPSRARAKSTTHGKGKAQQEGQSSEGEVFDWDAVNGSSDEEEPRKRGRPRKVLPEASKEAGPSPRKRVKLAPTATLRATNTRRQDESSEGEVFDFGAVVGPSDEEAPRKRGRPRKAPPETKVAGPSPRKHIKSIPAASTCALSNRKEQDESSEGEVFDFGAVSHSNESDEAPRRRGRPRKSPPRRAIHTQAQTVGPDLDSSDLFESDSIEDLGRPTMPVACEDALSRALEILSVASDGEIIIVSD